MLVTILLVNTCKNIFLIVIMNALSLALRLLICILSTDLDHNLGERSGLHF